MIRIAPAAMALELQQQHEERSFLAFPLIDANLNLFEIDNDFALQTIYDNKELSEIRVAPKYEYAKYPQGGYPDKKVLSKDKYAELLKEIEKIKPLGKLVRPGRAGVTMNSISTYLDQYENGLVYYAKTTLKKQKCYPAFRIIYYRKVSGKLVEKEMIDVSGIEYEYTIRIDERWYWTTEEEYRNHEVDENVSIESAAPFRVII
jgi:hypothetical protein